MKKIIVLLAILLFCAGAQAVDLPRDWPFEHFPNETGPDIVNACEGAEQALTDNGCRDQCYLPGHACYLNYLSGCWECHATAELQLSKLSRYCRIEDSNYYGPQACEAECESPGICYFDYPSACWQCANPDEIAPGRDCLNPENKEDCKYYYPMETELTDDFKPKLRAFYNQGLREFPEIAGSLLADDVVNVILDQEMALYLVTMEGSVTEVGTGHKEEASVILHLEEKTLESVLNGEKDFMYAHKTRELEFEGADIFNAIKLILISFILLLL